MSEACRESNERRISSMKRADEGRGRMKRARCKGRDETGGCKFWML